MSDTPNYFELMELPASFDIDEAALHKQYIALQQQYHPDKWVGKPEEDRIKAVNVAMDLNDAYETLKSPLERAQHLLALQGVFVNGEQDNVKPDNALLMEMMELREQLDEAENPAQVRQLSADAKEACKRCVTELSGMFAMKQYGKAAQLTLRLRYLVKWLEEIHTVIYYQLAEAR